MSWWGRLLIGAVAGVVVCGVAAAQTAPVRIVQGSDGSLYLLKEGARYLITVDAIDDDELGAYADGGALGSAELAAALGGSAMPGASAATSARSSVQAPAADNDSAPAGGTESSDAAPAVGSEATTATGAAAKTSATGTGQAVPTTQPPTASGVRRAGVPSLNFIKVQGAAPGGTALVSVQTTPGATCTLAYRTPAGTSSSAAGLGQQTADASGVATWSWVIGGNTRTGLGSISVNCGNVVITDTIQIGLSGGGTR